MIATKGSEDSTRQSSSLRACCLTLIDFILFPHGDKFDSSAIPLEEKSITVHNDLLFYLCSFPALVHSFFLKKALF